MTVVHFDIETVATPDMETRRGIYPEPERKTMDDAPGNYKKEDSIKRWIERTYKEDVEEWEEVMESGGNLPVDIDGAVIHTISFATGDGKIRTLMGDGSLKREGEIVRDFLQQFEMVTPIFCGYNVMQFDVPILKRAMMRHEIYRPGSSPIETKKYNTDTILDLMLILYNYGQAPGTRYRKLSQVAKILKIDPLYEDLDEEMDGSDFLALATGEEKISIEELNTMIAYSKNDVHLVREIYKKMKGIYF